MSKKKTASFATMGGYLFMLAFLAEALGWDFVIRLKNLLNPQAAYNFLEKYIVRSSYRTCELLEKFGGLTFVRERTAGLVLPPNFLIISNHQSLADIPVIMSALPERSIKFVAKKSLKRRVPMVSIYLRVGKHAFVNRKGNFRESNRELAQLAVRATRDRICPLVFPEGTRSRDGKLNTFQASGVRLLSRLTGLPVLSVALDGGYLVSNLQHFKKASAQMAYRIKLLKVYPPLHGKKEVEQVLNEISASIAEQLKVWRNS